MTHELRCYDYVNAAFETVRTTILVDPIELFRRATSAGSSAELHARLGALEVGAEIAIEVAAIEEARPEFGIRSTNISLTWRALRNQGLFPVMHAKFLLYPLSTTETQLELVGTYDPPLGIVGELGDIVAFHRFAKTSVARFVRDVAAALRRELAPSLGAAI